MFYAKRFSAYYFNSIRKLCFGILENSNNNNKRRAHAHLLRTIECTQQCHSLHFPTCIYFMVRTLCIVWYCFDFFHRFSFVLSLSFLLLRLSIGEFIFSSSSVCFGACLPFLFSSIGLRARLARTHCFILYWLCIFRSGWILSNSPSTQFITPTKKQRQKNWRNFSLRRLYLTCHLYFRIRFFKPINLTQPLSIFFHQQAKKGAKQKLPAFSLPYIIFIHRCCCCCCHHHLKIIARIFSFR